MTSATPDAALPLEDRMYHEIYAAIMEHRLPPRTKLTEQSLCKIYGTARHAVRKVLSRLAADGLVDLEPNRGAFIASPSPDEAQDMFELRQILEHAIVVKLAALPNPGKALAPVRRMVEDERAAFLSGDRERWIRRSAEFHTTLAALAENDIITTMMQRLVSRTTLLIANAETHGGHNACSFDEHFGILDALERGDAAKAQMHMAHHLECCAGRVRPDVREAFDLRSVLGSST